MENVIVILIININFLGLLKIHSSKFDAWPHQPAKCVYGYFTSHPVHIGRHVAGVLCGPESEIGVLVVTVVLVVFGRHRHEGFSSSNHANLLADTSHLSTELTLHGVTPSCLFVPNRGKNFALPFFIYIDLFPNIDITL